jgi:hypothetical protein
MAQHIGHQPTLQLPPYFQIDCWSTDAQQSNSIAGPAKHHHQQMHLDTQHIHRPSIKGRTIFWGSPKAPMNDTIDRITFTTEIQQTLSTYPGAVIGDISLKSKPEALYIQFTDVEVWDDIPIQFIESLLILSNTKGILTTSKTAEDWTES